MKQSEALPLHLLTIAFVVLKLCNVIDWSWWWVLSPLWGPFVLFLTIAISILIAVLIKGVFTK